MSLRSRLKNLIGADATDEAAAGSCEACGASSLVAFYEVGSVPAQTCVLLDTRAEAEVYPLGEILLALCDQCGFIQNVRFDPDIVDYSQPTEESQAFSPRFTEFTDELAGCLVERYSLRGRSVVEIGCGKGDFLLQLADHGIARGIGVDPGYLDDRLTGAGDRVEFFRDWFRGPVKEWSGDLVVTRHLMEHVPNTREFFGWLTATVSLKSESALFTEVPDTARVLKEGAFWDIYHEHCSYFTAGSLARALRTAGMAVDDLRLGFGRQYLLADSVPGSGGREFDIEEPVADIAAMVARFAEQASREVAGWHQIVVDAQSSGRPVAVWGGGSKAVAFLTSSGVEDVVVVDINPHKQGKWLPGTAVCVQDPSTLLQHKPALVIPMNPIYREEIAASLSDMGLAPELLPLGV